MAFFFAIATGGFGKSGTTFGDMARFFAERAHCVGGYFDFALELFATRLGMSGLVAKRANGLVKNGANHDAVGTRVRAEPMISRQRYSTRTVQVGTMSTFW